MVVVFRPEIIPAGAFGGLRATTVGFLTEPLPRTGNGRGASHEDLERRLWELGQVDGSNFDRIVAFDPLITATADRVLPVWRSIPLPVADRYYRPVTAPDPTAPPLFVGRSTEHREALLTEAKHRFDVLHLAFGVGAARLERLMDEHWMAINIHNEPYPSFENRVCLHLAAGHLVVSEPLSPSHGLESGIDYLEFQSGDHLARIVAHPPPRRDGVAYRARAGAAQGRAVPRRRGLSAPGHRPVRRRARLRLDARTRAPRLRALRRRAAPRARRRRSRRRRVATVTSSGSSDPRTPPIAAPRLGCEGSTNA